MTLEEEFNRAVVKKAPKPRFIEQNQHLVPFIREWVRRRKEEPETTANASDFYDDFLKPNGITISKDRFYAILRHHFRQSG